MRYTGEKEPAESGRLEHTERLPGPSSSPCLPYCSSLTQTSIDATLTAITFIL
jgi:hypothetical protein